jgi:general stress protein 26
VSTDINNPSAVRERLYKEVDDARFGMLGVIGAPVQHHFNPMACYPDKDSGRVWFFTKKGTDLVRDAGLGESAMFIVTSKDQEFQACIGGELRERFDREALEAFWNPHIAAWYPDGKDDPELTMLCFEPHDADVWISKAGPVKYAFEVAKANVTKTTPDIGERRDINLH